MSAQNSSPRAPMSVRRSLVLSFARKYTNIVLTVPTIMIVSRLLTPSQVGVYSVGMAFVTLIHSLRDFGVSDYIVQSETLDHGIAQSAFAINIMIAWFLGGVMLLCSGWAADFYSEPGLEQLLQILSINFFLLPFGSTINAMLKRSMQFGVIYKINLAQQSTQSGTTILLAYLGFGYIGLGWGSVAGTVALILTSLTAGNAYRIRGLSLRQWRPVANFGIQRTITDVVSKIGMNAPDFIIGRILDFAAVGLFSRGKGLINMFRQNVLGAIGLVTFPSYARSFRRSNNPHILYLKLVNYVPAISWPFMAFSALMAFPIMRIMFGDQWDGAVPILQILAVATMIGTTNMDAPQLLTAIGRVGLVTRIIVIGQSVRIPLLVGAAFYGLLAVAAVQVVTAIFNLLMFQRQIRLHTPATTTDFLNALKPCFTTTLFTMVVPLIVRIALPPTPDNLWLPLLLSAAGALVGWGVGLKVSRHPMGDEINGWLSTLYRRVGSAFS